KEDLNESPSHALARLQTASRQLRVPAAFSPMRGHKRHAARPAGPIRQRVFTPDERGTEADLKTGKVTVARACRASDASIDPSIILLSKRKGSPPPGVTPSSVASRSSGRYGIPRERPATLGRLALFLVRSR